MAYSADRKPAELTALTSLASDDTIIVGDTSDVSEVAKSITKANLEADIVPAVATTVTTNANLTGHVTSTGNAAVLGSFTKAQLDTAVSDDTILFDSEVTNLAQVKAFDSSDYATAAQGATADTALQDVIDDTTPTLGGDLAAGGNNITDLGDVTFKTGAAGGTLRTGTSAADKFQLQAYDVNDTTYRTLMEADAGNDVSLQLIADYLKFEDATDPTKKIGYDLSAITTATERTHTMPDRDLDFTNLPTAGEKTVLGNTSGTNTGDEDTASITALGALMDSELTDLAAVKATSDAVASDVNTGTDTAKFITPDALAGSNLGKKSFGAQLFASDGDTATGDGAAFFIVPAEYAGMNIVDVKAAVYAAGTTGTTDVQIRNVTDSVDVLSTKLTIDSGETTSETAATAAVINAANDDLAEGDVIAFDVDAVSTTAATGLTVTVTCQLP